MSRGQEGYWWEQGSAEEDLWSEGTWAWLLCRLPWVQVQSGKRTGDLAETDSRGAHQSS